MKLTACELCETDGGEVLFRHPDYRVVRVTGAEGDAYRGFCRVIWNHHIAEMSDLTHVEQATLMAAVFQLESALRAALKPDKINLASLGNMTPHLHWHVIPRFRHDETFPKPIWAAGVSPARSPSTPPSAPPDQPSNSNADSHVHFNVNWAQHVQEALMNGMAPAIHLKPGNPDIPALK